MTAILISVRWYLTVVFLFVCFYLFIFFCFFFFFLMVVLICVSLVMMVGRRLRREGGVIGITMVKKINKWKQKGHANTGLGRGWSGAVPVLGNTGHVTAARRLPLRSARHLHPCPFLPEHPSLLGLPLLCWAPPQLLPELLNRETLVGGWSACDHNAQPLCPPEWGSEEVPGWGPTFGTHLQWPSQLLTLKVAGPEARGRPAGMFLRTVLWRVAELASHQQVCESSPL